MVTADGDALEIAESPNTVLQKDLSELQTQLDAFRDSTESIEPRISALEDGTQKQEKKIT